MRVVNRSLSPSPVWTLTAYICKVTASERDDKEVIEVQIHDNIAEKGVAALCFDPPRYTREEICLTNFQAKKDESPLRAVSPGHEDEVMDL